MGKAARLKQERRVTKPPPVGKTATRPPQRMVLLATAGIAGIIVVVVIILLSTKSSPKTAPPAKVTASDANAPASLISAAQAVGFHPTTEAGVGEVESKPASAAPPLDPTLLAVGTHAPSFTLQTPQGASVNLATYRGHAVLLEFFASWCPHCNAEEPHLAAMARSLQSKGIRFLAVNADGETAPSVYAFHRYYGMSYPALVDPSSQPGSFNSPGASGPVSTAYKISNFPTFYVLDKTGKITWAGDGEQPDVLLRQELLKAAAGA
jgi:thiol-disulfide isomerase/thioredoxin